MEELEAVLQKSPEVSVEVASRWLGVTQRVLLDYLRAKQLQGIKVGEDWFVRSNSLLEIRPLGVSLQGLALPEVENPLSRHQQEKINQKNSSGREWHLKKGSRRSPLKLNCFLRLQEAWRLLNDLKKEFSEKDLQFFEQELLTISDELGGGYYSFGLVKRKLYGRARIRAGRLVSRSLLLAAPCGFYMSLCQVVEAITFLCRKMERKEGENVKNKTTVQGT